MVAAPADRREAEGPEKRHGPSAAGNERRGSGGQAVLRRATAQLAAVVGSPAIRGVPGSHAARMESAGRERQEDLSADHEDGHGRGTPQRIAHLAGGIVPPAIGIAARRQATTMLESDGDYRELTTATHRDRETGVHR